MKVRFAYWCGNSKTAYYRLVCRPTHSGKRGQLKPHHKGENPQSRQALGFSGASFNKTEKARYGIVPKPQTVRLCACELSGYSNPVQAPTKQPSEYRKRMMRACAHAPRRSAAAAIPRGLSH